MVLNNNLEVIKDTSALILSETSFEEYLANENIIFFGNGSEKAKPIFGHMKNVHFIPAFEPSAVHIGAIANKNLKNNLVEELAYFEPYYLKDFVGPKTKS